jgi:hypothetical protein
LSCSTHAGNEWLKRIGHADEIDIDDFLQNLEIFSALGQGAYTDPGVCNHDVGAAVARDKIMSGSSQGVSIPNISRIDAVAIASHRSKRVGFDTSSGNKAQGGALRRVACSQSAPKPG